MIGCEDAPFTYEYDDHFKILPSINSWSADPERINHGEKSSNFTYTSENNNDWMSKISYLIGSRKMNPILEKSILIMNILITQDIDDSDLEAVVSTLKSEWLTQGPLVGDFEKAISKKSGAQYAFATNCNPLHIFLQ